MRVFFLSHFLTGGKLLTTRHGGNLIHLHRFTEQSAVASVFLMSEIFSPLPTSPTAKRR